MPQNSGFKGGFKEAYNNTLSYYEANKRYINAFLRGFIKDGVLLACAIAVYYLLIYPRILPYLPQQSANYTNGEFIYTYNGILNNTHYRAVYIINLTYGACLTTIYAGNSPFPVYEYSKGLLEYGKLTRGIGYLINISSLNPTLCDP